MIISSTSETINDLQATLRYTSAVVLQ